MQLLIEDLLGNIMVETGEVLGQAEKYCIVPKFNKHSVPVWLNGFETGDTYVIKLKVTNDCGATHDHEVSFTMPSPNPCVIEDMPNEPNLTVIMMSPNPTTSLLNVEVEATLDGDLTIYGLHSHSGTYYGTVNQTAILTTIQIDAAQWQNGINSLIFDFEGHLVSEEFIKQ